MVLLVKGPAAQDKWQSKHRVVIMESVPHILFQRLPDLLLLPPCAFHFTDHVIRGRLYASSSSASMEMTTWMYFCFKKRRMRYAKIPGVSTNAM